jgi:transcription-repair coupling factor (superfamily II helicase)
VVNLLDYAVLKALAEKLLVANIDRKGDQLAIKFYEDTPLGPERLVKLIGKRRDMRLDPVGMLWLDWKRSKETGPMEAAKKVLLQLQS